MIKRSTLFLLIIFVVLLVFLLVWIKQKSNINEVNLNLEGTRAAESVDFLLNFPDDVFIWDIKVSDNEGGSVDATRETKEADWILIEPSAQDATDSQAISDVVSGLALTTVEMTLVDFAEFDAIGLKVPSYRIEIGLSDGSTHVMQIGNETVTNNQYYIRFDQGAPKVVSKTSIDPAINLINSPPILPTPTPQLQKSPTEGSS